MSAVSVLTAFLIFSATIFAGSIYANEMGIYDRADTIEVTKSNESIHFVNQPFLEKGVLYLPLKETLGNFIDFYDGVSTITWEEEHNEEILLHLFDRNKIGRRENGNIVYINLYYYRLQIGMPYLYGVDEITDQLSAAPILKENITYVPLEVVEKIKAESGLLDEFNVTYYQNGKEMID